MKSRQVTGKSQQDTSWKDAAQPRQRKLRSGERVDLASFGIPGVCLSGRGTEVLEYEDGTLMPIISNLGAFLRYTFVYLIVESTRVLHKEEVRFIRKHMNVTQEEFGNLLGLTRETISRIESGKDRVTKATSNNIRYCGIKHLIYGTMTRKKTAVTSHKLSSLLNDFHSNVERIVSEIPNNLKLELASY